MQGEVDGEVIDADIETSDSSRLNQVSKEIESFDIIQTQVNNDSNIDPRKIKYGKLHVCFYDKNNDPIMTIGPDWCYFLCMFIIDILFIYFMGAILWTVKQLWIKIIGYILSFIQLVSYFLTATLNPGLPKYNNRFLVNTKDANIKKCKECKLYVDVNKDCYHCYDCGVCYEGYDHHCPWTTKCVAAKNIKLFYFFITITFVTLFYFIFAVLMMAQ